MSDLSSPIELDFKSAQSSSGNSNGTTIRTFTSYAFERNILVPASAFRFSAPGVDKTLRVSVRSADTVSLFVPNSQGVKIQIGAGIIDESDTHIMPGTVDYILTGRDFLGQLVDNDAVDANNRIINTQNATLQKILELMIANTRIPQGYKPQQVPTGTLLFQTSPGETKISVIQRYLEFTNCLIWTQATGQIVLGKPNFTADRSGKLILSSSSPQNNNVVEARSRRNVNMAIRQIVNQLQTMDQVDAGSYTMHNADLDMKAVSNAGGGRSVYRSFNYGQGNDTVNQIVQVGNGSGSPNAIGAALGLREISRDNMKILDVEAVVVGHVNEMDVPYNIDQVYNVQLEDDNVSEDMYVYSCSYELTLDHGMLTRLKLCRLGTIVAYADAIRRTTQ